MTMKRFAVICACLAITLISLIPTPALSTAQPAYGATATYARANVRTAYFFTEKDTSTSIFAVPYTYCIEVLRDDGAWYYARYASDTGIYKAVYGYCRKEDFSAEVGTPAVTYLYKTVPIGYTASGGTGSSGGGTSLPTLGEITLEGAYYGVYYAGATVYSYVYCQGSFGYIEGANDDYPLNTPADGGSTDQPEDKVKSPKVNGGLIAFFAIFAMLVVVILVIFFTTRQPRAE